MTPPHWIFIHGAGLPWQVASPREDPWRGAQSYGFCILPLVRKAAETCEVLLYGSLLREAALLSGQPPQVKIRGRGHGIMGLCDTIPLAGKAMEICEQCLTPWTSGSLPAAMHGIP